MQSKDQHCYLKIWQKWQFFRFRFTESFGCENNLKIIYFFCTCSYFLWSGLCCSPRRIFTPTKVLRKLACTKFFTTTVFTQLRKIFSINVISALQEKFLFCSVHEQIKIYWVRDPKLLQIWYFYWGMFFIDGFYLYWN